MFESARLKLTAWYLLIIMVISIFFSFAFYTIATQEISRIIHIQQLRVQREQELFPGPLRSQMPTIEDLEESETRLTIILIIINLGIFIFSGGAGYFLAGRTLKPIKKMVDEQNRFISDSSHELRTPLTAVRTEIEVALRDKKLTLSQSKDILTSNLEEIAGMQHLTEGLLRLSQSKSETTKSLTLFSLKECLHEAIKRLAPLAKAKKITIRQNNKDEEIFGQRQLIVELFIILLDNAIKYSKVGGEVNVTLISIDSKVKITIVDKGKGIATEDIPFIFDRFYRAEKSRSKNDISGFGLGLSIAKKIVEEHKGTILITSVLEKGTTITIQLPKHAKL